jgi:hypothetical protein
VQLITVDPTLFLSSQTFKPSIFILWPSIILPHCRMANPREPASPPSPGHTIRTKSRSSNSRTSSLHLANMPSPGSQQRQSFSDSLRGLPPSPRTQRQPSLSQMAVQELIDNPPARNDPAFADRDWRSVSIGELISPDDLRFVEGDTGVEAATNVRVLLDYELSYLND